MNLKDLLFSTYYFLKLSVQSLSIMVRGQIGHHSAKTTFKKTLILNGVPQDAAKELSRTYPNPLNDVLSLIRARRNWLKNYDK